MQLTIDNGQPSRAPAGTVLLAVNGTLMRGLELNGNLTKLGATFEREDRTGSVYRLWSVDDRYPAMIRTRDGQGSSLAVEVWRLPPSSLGQLLASEPTGLSIGQVLLTDGTGVLGVLAEPYIVHEQREITDFGGWRAYIKGPETD